MDVSHGRIGCCRRRLGVAGGGGGRLSLRILDVKALDGSHDFLITAATESADGDRGKVVH